MQAWLFNQCLRVSYNLRGRLAGDHRSERSETYSAIKAGTMKSLALFALALIVSVPVLAQTKPADDFALGIWYEGGVGAARQYTIPEDPKEAAPLYDRTFKDIAAHNIKIVVVPNSPPEHQKLVLDTAQKHGLKVIIETGLDGGDIGAM